MLATLVLFGVAEPDLILQAFFNKTAAGGVFVMKLKLLSAYTSNNNRDDHIALVCCRSVELFRELYDVYTVLSKSRTYWRSWCSLSAGICNLIYPVTFFAIVGTPINCGAGFPPQAHK